MRIYAAEAHGWIWVGEAPTARQALSDAKSAAGSASLLSTDITSVNRATEEQIEWYRSMGGDV